jgi:hypothetical protein
VKSSYVFKRNKILIISPLNAEGDTRDIRLNKTKQKTKKKNPRKKVEAFGVCRPIAPRLVLNISDERQRKRRKGE